MTDYTWLKVDDFENGPYGTRVHWNDLNTPGVGLTVYTSDPNDLFVVKLTRSTQVGDDPDNFEHEPLCEFIAYDWETVYNRVAIAYSQEFDCYPHIDPLIRSVSEPLPLVTGESLLGCWHSREEVVEQTDPGERGVMTQTQREKWAEHGDDWVF